MTDRAAPVRPTAPDLRSARALPAARPAPEDVAALSARCAQKRGMVPNALRACAFAPQKLRAFGLISSDLKPGEGRLSKRARTMIAVAVSAANRRRHRLVANGAAVRQPADDRALDAGLALIRRAATPIPRLRAMLGFAGKMAKASSLIATADRQAPREAGLSGRDGRDVSAVASLLAMSDRRASAVGMRPSDAHRALAR